MEIKSLKKYEIPKYPQKEQVKLQPTLLRKTVFKRWQKLYDVGISGMLVAGLSLSGCDDEPANNSTSAVIQQDSANDQNPDSIIAQKQNVQKVSSLVAPVFGHGEGRGAFGCQSITPPAFISEDEALLVIKEELGKYDINIDKEKVVLNNVMIAHGKNETAAIINAEEETEVEPLEIDLTSSEKNINIEYICQSNYFELGGPLSGWSFQDYDFKQVAINVRNKLQVDTKQGVYAVFYDPMFSPDYQEFLENNYPYDQMEVLRKEGIESSKDLLRKQVNDFVEWLREQEVL